MSFTISGLPLDPFKPLFALNDEALAAQGVKRVVTSAKPGFPCRVSLHDAEPGQSVLLLNYEHQTADTPYRSSYAIYVNEAAGETWRGRNAVPGSLRGRPISLRAFSAEGMLVGAEVASGDALEEAITRRFADGTAAYLHAHNAAHGCFVARIDRG